MRKLAPAFVFAASLCVLLQYGLFEYPILEDRSYLIYLGQAILRGESIYANSYMAYPPLGPLISAGAMALGRLAGVPTWLAPRFAGVLVGAFAAVALGFVVRRATRSTWAGVLAGCVLAGFSQLARLTVSNLEPKALVVLLGLLSAAALQRRRWFLAGLAAGLGTTCWQPAGLFALSALAVTAWGARSRPLPALLRLAAGGATALLPTLAYLAASGGWWDFWLRAFVIPAHMRGTGLATTPWSWLELAGFAFASERVFFVTAAAGFGGFALRSLRGGPRGLATAWLHPSSGGVPIATLLWIAFNGRDFGGPPDILPMLPLLSFWTAWGAHRAVAGGARRLRRSGRALAARRFATASAVLLLVGSSVYAWADAVLYRPETTLTDLEKIVRRIDRYAGEKGKVASFDASEIYVLADRVSPNRFLSLNLYADPVAFERFLPLALPEGCEGLIRRLLAEETAVVVAKSWKRKSACVKQVEKALRLAGYRQTALTLPERRHGAFFPDPRYLRHVRWTIYWGARPAAGP